jgi:hypothetical protein
MHKKRAIQIDWNSVEVMSLKVMYHVKSLTPEKCLNLPRYNVLQYKNELRHDRLTRFFINY